MDDDITGAHLCPYVTYKAGRREPWKGHDSAEGVRRAITYDRSHPWGGGLRVFCKDTSNPYASAAYYTVPESNWDAVFFG